MYTCLSKFTLLINNDTNILSVNILCKQFAVQYTCLIGHNCKSLTVNKLAIFLYPGGQIEIILSDYSI